MNQINDDNDINHDIEIIRAWAKCKKIVKRVWLFGSRVRGDHTPESDLDVAIEHGVAPGDANAFTTAISERHKWIEDLQPQTVHELDIHSYRQQETPTVENGIQAGSKLIYDKEQGIS
jgi:predicted nucleotidyltransferase